MKKVISFILFITIASNVLAQSDYDLINRDEFYILRASSGAKKANNFKAAELKTKASIEKQFGAQCTSIKYLEQASETYFTSYIYNDGLELYVPDNSKSNINFRIKSDEYLLILKSGKHISVGMKANDLEAIFPKSFSKKIVIANIYGMTGKISFPVFFSYRVNNKVYIEDALLEFILDKDCKVLEEIHSIKPQ